MKIECTREQKELLIEIILSSNICLQEMKPYSTSCPDDCKECLDRNVEWEIYDDEEEESDGE